MNSFSQMTQDLLGARVVTEKTISQQDYERWRREFSFQGLTGIRYGQAFCNRFGITDYILYYNTNVNEAEQRIQSWYVRA